MLKNIVENFRRLTTYNPQKGCINESLDGKDTKGWICVGEIPYSPWASIDKLYVMVNPQKTMKYGKLCNEVIYTENKDGSGLQTEFISSYYLQQIVIYPEHQNDEFGEIFLGKRQDDTTMEKKHEEFVSKLFKSGNNVILHHNSSYIIKDAVIKHGAPNNWSNNTDIGIYFWGSRYEGNDPSGGTAYSYYCIVPMDEIYDYYTNAGRMPSIRQAMSQYKYVGKFWPESDAIVVTTWHTTPISYILDKREGKWYDENWEEIENPF